MASFQKRLQKCMTTGNLRVADIARWFDRRHSTIRGWAVDGLTPAGTPADIRGLFERLVELETLIREGCAGTPLRARIQTQARCTFPETS